MKSCVKRARKHKDRVFSLHGRKANGSGSVLKRDLHRGGHLNARIERRKQLLRNGLIADPAPSATQNVLNVVTAMPPQ
ncbi:TPA: hypothetical protein N0F65_011715 [Lagenidium giganteum]|uniref:Uncharacterized protein n=1 Tax=Lagenidium giganteum TaxID=4803 RepID=A0AAV2YFA5_9STRA|nr:TPA: hypothetical protein N0F65_011715 [Lagenidium giganteum]